MMLGLNKIKLSDIFEGIENIKTNLVSYKMINGDMPLKELVKLCQIVRFKQPKTIFEIGTFLGTTTMHLAANSTAQIYTLDIPVDSPKRKIEDPELDVYPAIPGKRFINTQYEKRIVQLFGDSMLFDFSPWYRKIDMVFVDACHHYENVKKDSETAFQLVSLNGYIIWHDYAKWAPGVEKAINQLSIDKEIINIFGTSLAIFCKKD